MDPTLFLGEIILISRIAQVQVYIGTLTDKINELESTKKLRDEYLTWLAKQTAIISDWASRPIKFRTEVFPQELKSMEAMKTSIKEKKVEILNAPEDIFSSEDTDKLGDLLIEIDNIISKKQNNVKIVENYNDGMKAFNKWIEMAIVKLDSLGQQNNMKCADKLTQIRQLKEDVESKNDPMISSLKKKSDNVKGIVNNLDSEVIDEQIRSVDRRYNDLIKRIDRNLQMAELTCKNFDIVKNEITQASDWVKEQQVAVKSAPGNFDNQAAEDYKQNLKSILRNCEGKKVFVDTIPKHLNKLKVDLEANELHEIEKSIDTLNDDMRACMESLKSEIDRVSNMISNTKALDANLEKLRSWISTKSADVNKNGDSIGLLSATIDTEIQQLKKHINSIKEFKNGYFSDVSQQVTNLQKECDPDNKEKLKNQMKKLDEDLKTLSDNCNKKLSNLQKTYKERQVFEQSKEKIVTWMNDAEVNVTSDIRTTNLRSLIEQKAAIDKIFKESQSIGNTIDIIDEKKGDILPTLNDIDKINLNNQMKMIKDKFEVINQAIVNKLKNIEEHINHFKEMERKFQECREFILEMGQQLKDLNKPVGCKIEDVQDLLMEHEKILGKLKEKRIDINTSTINKLPEYRDISNQLDDMINSIETQLSRLRQLLNLREQFITMLNEIVSFLNKYNAEVSEIEQYKDTSENKIKKYAEIIDRIHECEVVLENAFEKGKQIASEGTKADKKNIMEQLNPLKEQLDNFRKLVEKQKQSHEAALSHHKDMFENFTNNINWIHENMSFVKSRPSLSRNVESVDNKIVEHKELTENLNTHLNALKNLVKAAKKEKQLPKNILELVNESKTLINEMPNELHERETFLLSNREYRIEFNNLVNEFTEWIESAKNKLTVVNSYNDSKSTETILAEHNKFFNNESNIRKLLYEQIQQSADKIWPTITNSDQEKLLQDLRLYKQQLTDVLSSAAARKSEIENYKKMWLEYTSNYDTIKLIMKQKTNAEYDVSSVSSLHNFIENLTSLLNDLQVSSYAYLHFIYANILHMLYLCCMYL